MIVFCGGMIRSGSTLQFQIAARLMESRGVGERWPYLEPGPLDDRLRDLEGTPFHGVIKTHELTPCAITRLRRNEARALYSFRDLRDVAVSAMRAFGHDWPGMKSERVLANAVAQEALWRAQPGVLVQRYEQLVNDLPTAVADIAQHLGITLLAGEADALAKEYSMDRQRKKIADWAAAPGQNNAFHPTELLYGNHIDRGEIGTWKQRLDATAAKEISVHFSDWLSNHGYDLVAVPGEPEGPEESCFVPHIGWLNYERGDAVLAGLREGDFEYAEQAFLYRVLRAGDIFIDCGAHCGLYSRLAAQLVAPGGCTHAIEPAPHTFSRLQRNTASLSAGSVRLHPIALGDSVTKIRFVTADQGLSAYNHTAGPDETVNSILVEQVTLPFFFEKNNLTSVEFMKIDAEGQEWAILNAATPLIMRGAIRTLMIEFNPENLARYAASSEDLVTLLSRHGYQFYALDPAQFRLVEARPTKDANFANFFATKDRDWLQARFDDAPAEARRISSDMMRNGNGVAFLKQRLLANIREQNDYIGILQQERARLQGATSALKSQLDQLAACSQEQTNYIAELEKTRDRLTTEAQAAQAEAKRAAKDGQKHIDELLAQNKKLAATSQEQTNYIAILEKERDRITALTATKTKEIERLGMVIDGQTAYIKALETQRASLPRK